MASVLETAGHLFMTDRRLYELIELGVIDRQGRGAYDLDQVREQYIKNLRAQAERAGRPTGGGISDPDRDRHMAARADLAELDLAAKRREFIPANDVAAAVNLVISNMKVRLEAIPTHAAPLVMPEKPAKAEKILSAHIRTALEDLSQVQVFPAPATGESTQ